MRGAVGSRRGRAREGVCRLGFLAAGSIRKHGKLAALGFSTYYYSLLLVPLDDGGTTKKDCRRTTDAPRTLHFRDLSS